MANRRFPHPDSPKTDSELALIDELDGSFSLTGRAYLMGWSATDGGWIKLAVTSAGVLSGIGGGGGIASIVDQGAPGLLAWKVDGSAVTQPVSGAISVSGSTIPVTDNGGSLTVDGTVSLAAGAATIGKIDQGAGGTSAWKIDGSAVTQPVSGTVTATIDSTQVSALAQDATLGPVAAKPSAYTLNDRLYQIAQKLDKGQTVMATEATLQRLLAATAPPKPKPYTTLLHRG